MEPKNLSFLNNGSLKFINIGKIDVRCNKYAIINFFSLAPIPHEGIVLTHIIIFHAQDEIE